MTAITTANTDKVQIVVDFIKAGVTNKTQFAQEKGISARSLNRYLQQYSDEAQKLIANASKPAKAGNKGQRGFQGRTGRVALLQSVYEELGLETEAKTLWEAANARAAEQGMKEINRGSFYAMLSIARKKNGVVVERKTKKEAAEA